MTWAEFDDWGPRSVEGSVEQQVAAGLSARADALASTRRQFDEQLPDGIATPLQLLRTVRADEPDRPVVGHLWLRVRPGPDEVEAYVMDVEVLEHVRGRGYGRATVLAAVDLSAELGATVLRLNVFGANEVALRLYESLGLQVTATLMTRSLGDPATDPQPGPEPEPGDGPRVDLRPMTTEGFAARRPRLVSDYAANLVRAGSLPPSRAKRHAEDNVSRLLPDGPSTPDQLLWTAYDGDPAVGFLWLGLTQRSDGLHAYGYQLEVEPALRRRGYASAMLAAALPRCRELGVVSVGLSVFDFNAGARRLYEQQGFRVTARSMAMAMAR